MHSSECCHYVVEILVIDSTNHNDNIQSRLIIIVWFNTSKINELVLVGWLFMYRINNELVLNSQNESTYLEGPLGPERG